MIKNKLPSIDTSLINESSNINTNYDKQIFNNNNNNKNINNILNKRNKFNAINLFLIQDDRTVNEINNPILSFSHKKAPTPKFRSLSGLKKKINFDDYPKKNDLKFKSSNHVFDVNNELINVLNKQMNLIQKNNQKLFYFYDLNNNNNNKNKHIKKNNENENKKEKLKKISSLNPFLFYKIKDNNQKIPFQFKNITFYKNLINNNNNNNNKNVQNLLNNRFNKEVNLEDILILHNSTVRKSVSQIKVKKYFFKQSLKLKNRPVYNTFRERINKSSKEFYNQNNNKINNLYNIYNNVKDVYL